jgi:Protein of unknown function (DUF4058)
MPAHDWTRVDAGTFHAFHLAWMAELQKTLNREVLPADFYALAEQLAGNVGPDVLTLQSREPPEERADKPSNGVTGTALAPPRVRFTARLDTQPYARKARQLVIRHASDDRVVALLEILLPGNKRTRVAMRRLVDKAFAVVDQGYHLVLVDLFSPGPGDPQGVHGALWADLGGEAFVQPKDKPLTLAAYAAAEPITCYVEPFAVGDVLADMPLFLDAEAYVYVPLEATYLAAWEGVPQRWRKVLEGTP